MLAAIAALAAWCGAVSSFDLRGCEQALGMESGAIPDSAVTASSSYVPNVGPKNGRLRLERAGGAWCPKPQVESGVREWLEVDLGSPHVLTGLQSQGRFDHGRGQEYTEEYTLEYWRPGLPGWRQYSRWDGKQILTGNSDTATVVSHKLMPPVFATKLRVLPYSVHRRTVCLRIELLGCPYSEGVVSYSLPRGSSEELSDLPFDGEDAAGLQLAGLGRLVDGLYGGDNFKMDIGLGKGSGWVGWRNDTFPKGYVELVFEFDTIRNFTLVNIFTNNCFSKEVQVFSKARVLFSLGGEVFSRRSVSYTYMPDRVLENARNVTIQLHSHIAKFVKIQLFFADLWLLISEVTFDSEPVDANVTEEIEASMAQEEIIIKSGGSHNMMLDSYETIAAPTEENGYVEIVIGVLTAVMLLLLGVFVIILVLSRRQKHQGSPTTILRNPFGVTINMKDLLMNLSPLNTSMVHISSQPTPASQDLPSDGSSMGFEATTQHYHTPLVSPYYTTAPAYASVRTESPARTPPSQQGVELIRSESGVKESDEETTTSSHSQTKTMTASKSLGRGSASPYAVTCAPGSPVRKRYHTAPREKHRRLDPPTTGEISNFAQTPRASSPLTPARTFGLHSDSSSLRHSYLTRMAPPAVSWNIAPSMGQPYKCREGELIPVPRYCLRISQRVGTCEVGEVFMCEMEGEEVGKGRVLVKTIRGECLREAKLLSSLNDQNVVRTIGVCTSAEQGPPWLVTEHPAELGDLCHLLTSNESIKYSCLLFMTIQIASGMKYLESKNLVHKDLAARNCLVARGYTIKIADVAICNPDYENDYSAIGGRPPAPIRWMPWESILLDRHTCSSSVWSFAVTMWEIFSHCSHRPFENLANDEVVQNAEQMYYGGELPVYLPKPKICTNDTYEMMIKCWSRDQELRPTFRELYMFLKKKQMGDTLSSQTKKIEV